MNSNHGEVDYSSTQLLSRHAVFSATCTRSGSHEFLTVFCNEVVEDADHIFSFVGHGVHLQLYSDTAKLSTNNSCQKDGEERSQINLFYALCSGYCCEEDRARLGVL